MYKYIRKVWNSTQQKLTLGGKFINFFPFCVVHGIFKQNLDDYLPRTGCFGGKLIFICLRSPKFYSSPIRIL